MIKPLFQELSLPLWTELPGSASEPPSDAVIPLQRSLLTAANTNALSEYDHEDDDYEDERRKNG